MPTPPPPPMAEGRVSQCLGAVKGSGGCDSGVAEWPGSASFLRLGAVEGPGGAFHIQWPADIRCWGRHRAPPGRPLSLKIGFQIQIQIPPPLSPSKLSESQILAILEKKISLAPVVPIVCAISASSSTALRYACKRAHRGRPCRSQDAIPPPPPHPANQNRPSQTPPPAPQAPPREPLANR